MYVKFSDGARFEIKSWQCDEYVILREYLNAKRRQARNARNEVAEEEAEKDAADRATVFGPLKIFRKGVEWNSIYYSWDQIEGYEFEHGFLLIRSVDGDEFIRRTIDLGDWRTALDKLKAASRKMAGKKRTAPR